LKTFISPQMVAQQRKQERKTKHNERKTKHNEEEKKNLSKI